MTTEALQRRIRFRLDWIEEDLKTLEAAPFWADEEALVDCIKGHSIRIGNIIADWRQWHAAQ